LKPQTKYTKSGRINIAYQVLGEGRIDIVYIPGWVSNIDLMWECPQLVDFLQRLNKYARVILFDKRGTGLSDRIVELSSIEERMDDIRAVMDAVGSKRAVLFGHSEGGSASALFAATYPDRTLGLITFGVFAKRRYSPDYPWAPTTEERQEVYDMIESSWGSGDMDLVSLAPSMADDTAFMDWLARYFRSGASPSAALALTKMNTEVDIIDILDTIEVPTLLMCRTHDIDVKVEESQFMAERIKGSKFVEFEGDDHLFWAGNTDEVLDKITNFLTEAQATDNFDRRLATILSAEFSIVQGDHDKLSERSKTHVSRIITQFRGRLVDTDGDRVLATFDGPSKAVHCAVAIKDAMRTLNIKIRQGMHIGECIFRDNNISGLAVETAQEVLQLADHGEIILTKTVKNLLSGSGLEFIKRGSTKLEKTGSTVDILSVEDKYEPASVITIEESNSDIKVPQNHSFLENVLQSIEINMSNELYSLDLLCSDIGMSPRQLQRKLKSIANKTPNQMIRSVRLHKAKELLQNPDEGVSQIAYSTGFNNVSYFTKCFRKEFGMAPTELR